MSELDKDAASKAVTGQDVKLTVAHKLIGRDELMAPVTLFVAKNIEEKTGKVGNEYKTEGKVEKVPPSPPLSEPCDL